MIFFIELMFLFVIMKVNSISTFFFNVLIMKMKYFLEFLQQCDYVDYLCSYLKKNSVTGKLRDAELNACEHNELNEVSFLQWYTDDSP